MWGIDPTRKPHAVNGDPESYYNSLLDEYKRLESIDVIQKGNFACFKVFIRHCRPGPGVFKVCRYSNRWETYRIKGR